MEMFLGHIWAFRGKKKNCEKNDENSFLFSLNKNKKFYPKEKDLKTIYCYQDYGPWFYGGEIGFYNKDMTECESSICGEYLDEPLSTNKPNTYFKVQEVEFYRILIEW